MALQRVFLEAAKGDLAKPKPKQAPAPKPTLVEVDIAGKTVEIEIPLSPKSPQFSAEIDKRARAIERDMFKKGIIPKMVGSANVKAAELKAQADALRKSGDVQGAAKLLQRRANLLSSGKDIAPESEGGNPSIVGNLPPALSVPLTLGKQLLGTNEAKAVKKTVGDAFNKVGNVAMGGNVVAGQVAGKVAETAIKGVGMASGRPMDVAAKAAGQAISAGVPVLAKEGLNAANPLESSVVELISNPDQYLARVDQEGSEAKRGNALAALNYALLVGGPVLDVLGGVGSASALVKSLSTKIGKKAAEKAAMAGASLAKDLSPSDPSIGEAILARAKFNQIPGVSDELKTFTPEPRPAKTIGGPEVPPQVPARPKSLKDVFTEAANAPKSTPIPGASDDVVGLAKQITKRDPLPGTNPARVFDAGKEAVETGRINPSEVVSRVKEKGVTNLAEDEIGATVYRLRQIRNRQAEIEAATKTGDPLETIAKNKEWADLDAEAEDILTAGDMIGNQWHRTGMALQVAIKRDMSLGGLVRRAKAFSDEPLKPGVEAQLKEISRKYEDAMRQLDNVRKTYNDDPLRIIRPDEPPRFMVKSRVQARKIASSYFENKKLPVEGGVGRNRQRGAVSYTVSDDEMRAKSAVRKLAREIVTDGAQTLDEVLDGIRREIGVDVKDEDLLSFLHEPYSKYRLEADTARIKANQVFRELQRSAAFRAMGKFERVKNIAFQGFNGIGRSLTLGFDFSAPFIQGRKFLYTNPKGWAKAFRPMFEATFQTAKGNTDYALSRVAKIESDPAYARAKSAGLQLTLPNAGFTQQEEIFSGNIRAYLEMLAASKPKAKIAKRVADIIGASEDAYTVFLNEVRWNTFKDMMKAAPDNPEYLRDVAQLLNVISGRGTGQFAQSLSNPIFGNLLTAPRYTASQIQYGIGVPLWNAKTRKGFAQAARVYGVQAAVVPSLMALAAMHGWKVDWDLRSSNVGKISKDGITIDLFGKDAQFMRLMVQSARGRFNKKGEFSDASATGVAENLGRYITGKVAPFPRMIMTERFGVYDDGQTRPVEAKDRIAYFMPIWVSDMFKDAEKFQGDKRKQALATLSNIFGLEVKPEELPETRMPAGFGVIGD